MENWFVDKEQIKQKTVNAVMGELESLIDDCMPTANYWIDATHNVFAEVSYNIYGDKVKRIILKLELYDCNDEIIGDLITWETEDFSKHELVEAVKFIVNFYYGEQKGINIKWRNVKNVYIQGD